MNESPQSARVAAIQFLAKALMVIGVLVFLLGDRFLRNVMHLDFWAGEAIGILSGLLLCAIGFALGNRPA
ncbi:hypothetical protein [Occallatibacter savannae]|uniref:hypothetical protein n=1 Tax=Occallatibacter savannae TaxID=1002691 RepID=UPI000D6A00AC|nr:hypothetical protein [Occallatibacter savannae]